MAVTHTPVLPPFMFVSIEQLPEKLEAPLLQRLMSVWDTVEDCRRLHRVLLGVRAVVRDLEVKMVEGESAALCLKKLEGLVGFAEDVVDKLGYEALRLHAANDEGRDQVRFSTGSSGMKQKLANKIDFISERLVEIESLWVSLRSELRDKPKFFKNSSSCSVTEPCFFGREKEIEEIVNWLSASEGDADPSESCGVKTDNNLSILAIIGIEGVGKTSLARQVYNDRRVENYFDSKMWFSVSETLYRERSANEAPRYFDEKVDPVEITNVLRSMLEKNWSGNRFLFILDGMWDESDGNWQQLFRALVGEGQICKVILTTNVPNVACATKLIHLDGISPAESWSFLKKIAFCGTKELENDHNLQEIGEKIVKKLNGVPLAIKALANLLKNDVREEAWKDILGSDIWELKQEVDGVLPALLLSYQYLPTCLQVCFSYCALFPKCHLYEKSGLVKYWMAQSYLPIGTGTQEEDVGSYYFDELVRRGFLEFYSENKYIMHGLVHSFVMRVSQRRILQLKKGNKYDIHKLEGSMLYHLTIIDDRRITELHKLNNLRSLLFYGFPWKYDVTLLHNLLDVLKCLRLLDFSNSPIQHLPDSIGKLKCLRYLNLNYSKIIKLPRAILELYNLIVLEVKGCHGLEKFPEGIKGLVNLRHLNMDVYLAQSIPGIGGLTLLQELRLFNVLRKEGFRLRELGNLNKLQGELHISNIKEVENQEEALDANLKNKNLLTKLVLEWTEDRKWNANQRNWELEESVLESLQPPPELQDLSIIRNGGFKFSGWANCEMPLKLKTILLSGCNNWEHLPPLGHLPLLQSLNIESMHQLKRIGYELFGNDFGFPSLLSFKLRDMPKLEDCLAEGKVNLPCLKELILDNCPILEHIILPQSLTTLKISKCTNLKHLDIKDQHNLKEVVLEGLHSLHSIKLENCSDLASLPPINHMDSLKQLIILKCRSIKCLDINGTNLTTIELKYLTDLEWLSFSGCDMLTSIILEGITFLRSMVIANCSKLFALKHSMTAVEKLIIRDCKLMTSVDFEGFISIKKLVVVGSGLINLILLHSSSLEELKIEQCDGMEMIGIGGLVPLQIIHISLCESLKYLKFEEPAFFLSLQNMKISKCPVLVTLELCHLTALKKLTISECRSLTLTGFEELVCLKSLHIRRVNQPTIHFNCLTCLEKLCVRDCSQLELLHLEGLPALQLLVVYHCPKLTSLFLHSLIVLEELEFSCCEQLASIRLNNLIALKKLVIRSCSIIEQIIGESVPTSLDKLDIWMCPMLEEHCNRSNWYNIPPVSWFARKKSVHVLRETQSWGKTRPLTRAIASQTTEMEKGKALLTSLLESKKEFENKTLQRKDSLKLNWADQLESSSTVYSIPPNFEELLPSDYADILWRAKSPVSYISKKDIYNSFCNPILLDEGHCSFSIDRLTGKKCYMLSARKLIFSAIWDVKDWTFRSDLESRFGEVAELSGKFKGFWLRGSVGTFELLPKTTYVAHLVYKLRGDATGFEGILLQTVIDIEGLGSEPGAQSQNEICVHPKGIKLRDACDEWKEVALGEFFNGKGGAKIVEVELWEAAKSNEKTVDHRRN